MEQLRVHVERIVRPITAAVPRKNKMREELLAHLVAKTRELTFSGMDEAEARAKAIEQLGEPDALRDDMQATVPPFERVACVRLKLYALDALFEKEKSEITFHYAWVRTIPWVVFLIAWVSIFLAIRLAGLFPESAGRLPDTGVLRQAAPHILGAYAAALSAFFVSYYLTDMTGLRKVLSKTTPYNGWIKGAALWLHICAQIALIHGLVLLYMRVFVPGAAGRLIGMFLQVERQYVIAGLLLLLAAFPVLSIVTKKEREQWVKWDGLDIGE